MVILTRMATADDYLLSPDTRPALLEYFGRLQGDPNFGNAREARKLFEGMRREQARRLRRLGHRPSLDDLRTLTVADVLAVVGPGRRRPRLRPRCVPGRTGGTRCSPAAAAGPAGLGVANDPGAPGRERPDSLAGLTRDPDADVHRRNGGRDARRTTAGPGIPRRNLGWRGRARHGDGDGPAVALLDPPFPLTYKEFHDRGVSVDGRYDA